MQDMERQVHASIFIPNFDRGGVERMMVNIARALQQQGLHVDFLTRHRNETYLKSLPSQVRLIALSASDTRKELTSYLSRVQPETILSSKPENDLIAIECVRKSSNKTRAYARLGTPLSPYYQWRRHHALKHWLQARALRRAYHQADGVICVSRCVADDLQKLLHLPESALHVLPNPTITSEIMLMADEPLDHPWFAPDQPPIILGAGRLSKVKNFPLLIRAFAQVRQQRPCRLVLLGSGKVRYQLLKLAQELGVDADVALPGFVSNPYTYMAKAALFVLSSNIEGSPNTLVEAMACGTPVVSTDCPCGPREILENGRHGLLIPMDDQQSMVSAITATLDSPPARGTLHAAVARYTIDNSALHYMKAMDLATPEAHSVMRLH